MWLARVFFGGGEQEGRFSQPLSEAFPLAQQPHLLRLNAKKEQLFSSPGRLVGEGGGEGGGGGEEREERRRGRRELPVSYESNDGRLALLDLHALKKQCKPSYNNIIMQVPCDIRIIICLYVKSTRSIVMEHWRVHQSANV